MQFIPIVWFTRPLFRRGGGGGVNSLAPYVGIMIALEVTIAEEDGCMPLLTIFGHCGLCRSESSKEICVAIPITPRGKIFTSFPCCEISNFLLPKLNALIFVVSLICIRDHDATQIKALS